MKASMHMNSRNNFEAGEAEGDKKVQLSPVLWSKLPLELIREILLILAKSSVRTARQLRLVSNDVNILVLPILFRHIVMISPEHVIQLTTTLLPKRRNYVPALRSKLHIIPRLLSSYKVDSWVLVVSHRRPSVETALASIAPVFTGLSKLVITGQNLSSNAFWLRKHPIHPKIMFLVHYGSPHLVNFYDPIFKSVTHLYTCITNGHRYSRISDLPALTHLAVGTRASLPAQTALNVASSINWILKNCDNLVQLVLLINFQSPDDPLYRNWEGWLERALQDKRFVLLPDHRLPRQEWSAILDGKKTLWDRARDWREMDRAALEGRQRWIMRWKLMENGKAERAVFHETDQQWENEWEIDLVQRDDYQPHAEDPDLRVPTGFISAFG